MIEVENLSKRYGEKLAVDGLSFVVQPGIVTGFLGPNGAGKFTTMRMIAGLDEPTAGRVVVNGRRYRSARAPMAELGGFSLGMGQRLGVASALLGNPNTVVLDEPTVVEFVARASASTVTVRTPEAARLRDLLLAPDITVTPVQPDVLAGRRADGRTDRHRRVAGPRAHLRASGSTGLTGTSVHDTDQRLGSIPCHSHRGGGGMTAALTPAPASPAISREGRLRLTQSRVVLSEWTKFRSLRSTVYTLLAAAVLMIGLGALLSAVAAGQPNGLDAGATAISTSLTGTIFAQLAIGVLGVLLITGE